MEYVYLYLTRAFSYTPIPVVNDLSSGGDSAEATSASTFTGTIAYMSPERLKGQPYNFKVSFIAL